MDDRRCNAVRIFATFSIRFGLCRTDFDAYILYILCQNFTLSLRVGIFQKVVVASFREKYRELFVASTSTGFLISNPELLQKPPKATAYQQTAEKESCRRLSPPTRCNFLKIQERCKVYSAGPLLSASG